MKAIGVTMSVSALLITGYGGAAEPEPPCPVHGEVIQWVADYCMFKLETDDEIAVSDCIADEMKAGSKGECAAKIQYKQALCEVTIKAGVTQGPVERCVADGSFMGSMVRSGGVSGRQEVPADVLAPLGHR